MKYCTSCYNLFEENKLQSCICDNLLLFEDHRIVTKSGVKYFSQKRQYCNFCVSKHEHKGEAFL